MMRLLLVAGIVLGLSACATTQKSSSSEAVALPDGERISRSGLAHKGKKRSPYAPAREDLSKRGHYKRGGLYAPHIKDSAPDDLLHDVDEIPEPEVVNEPKSRYGNRPYSVLGKNYTVRDSAEGYREQGEASYYGAKFHGRRTSNMEVYDMYAFSAAHKSLPLPSFARVTNLDNGKSVVVRVNDRGPFHGGRIIDLSYAAAVKLGYRNQGTAHVEVVGLSAGENARHQDGLLAKAEPAAPVPEARPAAAPTPSRAAATPAAATAMDKMVGMLPIGSAQAAERGAKPLPAGVRIATGKPTSLKKLEPAAAPGREWRFDMQQDGKVMTADEFEAWMQSRRARVATGKAATPAPPAAIAPAASPAPAVAVPRGERVTLQVASFANQTNAGHALAMLQRADIAGARIMDAKVNGRQIWRLRVGPVEASSVSSLTARVVGMGFDQPHQVRE